MAGLFSQRDRTDNLKLRALTLLRLRSALDERGYLEVETPVLVRAAGLEPHLEAIDVEGYGTLAGSPEYQMKRLLSQGYERIYYLGKAFRGGESGDHHNVEFTLLEWYRAGAGYLDLAAETEALVAEVAEAVNGTTRVNRPGWGELELKPPWERKTVSEAMREHAGVELWLEEGPGGEWDRDRLREEASKAGVSVRDDMDSEEMFFRVFVEKVEPRLGRRRPTILYDWPVPLAALSRVRSDGGRAVAERFEVFAGGLELANAFGELTDGAEQRARLERDQRIREAAGKPVYPVDEKFLSALEQGIPDCAGIALGVDRLIMLLSGAKTIREVMAFAFDEL